MPKYYIQCGPDGKGIFQTDNSVEACFALICKILDNEDLGIAPFIVVSEAGFQQDIVKWGDQEMQDQEILFSASSILRLMELDELADNLDDWCREQHNPILMQALADVKNAEEYDG